jgi:hypothetical protein
MATLQQWGAMTAGAPRLVVDGILELADEATLPPRVAIGDDSLPWIERALERRLEQVRARP